MLPAVSAALRTRVWRPSSVQRKWTRGLFVVAGERPVDLRESIGYPYPAWILRVDDRRAVTFLPPNLLATKDVPADAFVMFGPRAENAPLSSFSESKEFRQFLTSFLAARVYEEPYLIGMAKIIGRHGAGGHVHLFDQRNPPAPNRVGDPDDLIGLVGFDKKGNLEPNSFEAVSEHRLYRDIEGGPGLMILPEHLHSELVKELLKKVEMA